MTDFSAALGLLQGLLQAEEDNSDSRRHTKVITDADVAILSTETPSAKAALFWQASADANISVYALSRYRHNTPLEMLMHFKALISAAYSPQLLRRGLTSLLEGTDITQAWNAAAVLTSLLALPGAPVSQRRALICMLVCLLT